MVSPCSSVLRRQASILLFHVVQKSHGINILYFSLFSHQKKLKLPTLHNAKFSLNLHFRMTALLIESVMVNLISVVSTLPVVDSLGKGLLPQWTCVVFGHTLLLETQGNLNTWNKENLILQICTAHGRTSKNTSRNKFTKLTYVKVMHFIFRYEKRKLVCDLQSIFIRSSLEDWDIYHQVG